MNIDGQKPLLAWNLFTEKWSLLSFYVFNLSSYSTAATERTTTAIKIIFLCCVCIFGFWLRKASQPGFQRWLFLSRLTAGIIILSFSHTVRWLIRQMCTSFKQISDCKWKGQVLKKTYSKTRRPYGPTPDHSYVDTLVCRDDCKQSRAIKVLLWLLKQRFLPLPDLSRKSEGDSVRRHFRIRHNFYWLLLFF